MASISVSHAMRVLRPSLDLKLPGSAGKLGAKTAKIALEPRP
jgi:hypothetical protein